jgi:predicted DNA-binding transcriptional regulator AlpA
VAKKKINPDNPALREVAMAKVTADGACFLTRAEVLEVVGVTYPALWQWMRDGKFPLAREIGNRRIGWLSSEVAAWMKSRPVRKLKAVA